MKAKRRRKPIAARELRRPLRELVASIDHVDGAPHDVILDFVTGPFERRIVPPRPPKT